MDPLTILVLILIGVVVGLFGAMLGIGGGVLIVPLLVLGLHMQIHTAIAASLISVIATSCATATMTTGQELVNIRLGMFLETSTTLGAIAGAFVSVFLLFNELAVIFIVVILISGLAMVRKRPSGTPTSGISTPKQEKNGGLGLDRAANRQAFASRYYDAVQKATISYVPVNLRYGWGMSFFAGLVSGIIGIGGGVIKVPAMNVIMKVPIKVASATSNFMIGVTAVASAFVFYTRGLVDVVPTAALLLGVFPGSIIGFRLSFRARRTSIRYIFAGVLVLVAVLMAMKVLGLAQY